jgi:hypothetical protein
MIASASTLVPSGTIPARRRTIEGDSAEGLGAIQDGMGDILVELHSGQDGADRCVLYDGERPFRNGIGGEGVRDAWEKDGEVELVGGFYIHVVMKQKFGFFHCDGLYVL